MFFILFLVTLIKFQAVRWWIVCMFLVFGLVITGSVLDRLVIHNGFIKVSYCEDRPVYRSYAVSLEGGYRFYEPTSIPGFFRYLAQSRDLGMDPIRFEHQELFECLDRPFPEDVEEYSVDEIRDLEEKNLPEFMVSVPEEWFEYNIDEYPSVTFMVPPDAKDFRTLASQYKTRGQIFEVGDDITVYVRRDDPLPNRFRFLKMRKDEQCRNESFQISSREYQRRKYEGSCHEVFLDELKMDVFWVNDRVVYQQRHAQGFTWYVEISDVSGEYPNGGFLYLTLDEEVWDEGGHILPMQIVAGMRKK